MDYDSEYEITKYSIAILKLKSTICLNNLVVWVKHKNDIVRWDIRLFYADVKFKEEKNISNLWIIIIRLCCYIKIKQKTLRTHNVIIFTFSNSSAMVLTVIIFTLFWYNFIARAVRSWPPETDSIKKNKKK